MFREKPYMALVEPEPIEEPSRFRFSRFPSKPVETPVYMKGAECTELVPEICGLQDTKLPRQAVRGVVIKGLPPGEVLIPVTLPVSNYPQSLLDQVSFLEGRTQPTTTISPSSGYYLFQEEGLGITAASPSILSGGGSTGILEAIEKHTGEMLKQLAIDPRFLREELGYPSMDFRSPADNEPFEALNGKTVNVLKSEQSEPESKPAPYPEGLLPGKYPFTGMASIPGKSAPWSITTLESEPTVQKSRRGHLRVNSHERLPSGIWNLLP